MNEYELESLMEEYGVVICPLCSCNYTYCDEDCDKCEIYIDFVNAVENNK